MLRRLKVALRIYMRRETKRARAWNARWASVPWYVRVSGALAGCLLLPGAICCVPWGPWTTLYCAADAVDRWSNSDRILTTAWFGIADHLVEGNRLYLRVQSTRPGLVIVPVVDSPDWTRADFSRYRAAHPEIEPLLPDPDAANGGIRWLGQ